MNYGVYPPGGYPPPPSNGPMPPQGVCPNVPQGMPPQGVYQNIPQGVPPQGAYQNVPQGVPPQGAYQNVPQGMPPQGAYQNVPQGMPPQGAYQNAPQGMPSQGAYQNVPQGVPPQGAYQNVPQGVPPQGAYQNVPQGVPPQGAYQNVPQGVPPQGMYQTVPQGVPQNVGSPYGGVFPAGYGALPVYPPPFAMGGKPPRDPRQQGASRAVNRMCLLALAQVALSFVWQIPLQMLLAAVGVNILTNGLGYQWLAGVLAPLSTALPFVAYLIFRREDPSDYLKFEKTGFSGGVLCVLGGLAIVLLGNYPAAFISDFFSAFGYQSAASLIFGEESLVAVLLEIGVTALLVPFMEELVFRGIVLSSLRKYGIGFSIVASALIFGMAHMDFSTAVFAFIAGLVFGFLYAKTNNLWLAVWIHALNNLIAVVGSHAGFLFGDMAVLVDNLIVLIPLGVGLAALLLLALFKRGMFISYRSPRYDGPPQPLMAGESASAIVRAPGFWVVLGLMVLYTLSMFLML